MVREIAAEGEEVDEIMFWKNSPPKIAKLRKSALSHLASPASSASIERVWSYAGILSKGLRNRSKNELINSKLMLFLNQLDQQKNYAT